VKSFAGPFVPAPDEPQYAPIHEFPIVEQGPGFNVRDLGEGVLGVATTTKMGAITPELVEGLKAYFEANGDERFVLTSEAKAFSVGFDLNFFMEHASAKNWVAIEAALVQLQELADLLGRLKIVAAVHGYCLGAGTELAIACPMVAAHPDSQIGLPEAKVGLLPGGGGAARLALRSQSGGARRVVDVCMAISKGFTSSCADEAKAAGFLRTSDVTVYHPDRLLFDARRLAKTVVAAEDQSWSLPGGPIGGMIDQEQKLLKSRGEFSDHDELIADKIKHVFVKSTSFADALSWERTGFGDLCHTGLTLARIKHMLETSKPLRN
jgi:3-hydroxyacyl-CoA dehydrogenase